jgi:myo-inositol-1(or 4)-monophosphatase
MGNPQSVELVQTCEAAARAGGRELLAWRGRFQSREKGVADYVTDADLASQVAIQQVIAAQFPDHHFIGEEQPPESLPERSDQMNWIVDPLDGTTNYIHDFPCYAVSVAAARGTELLAGVIYDPVHDKCYAASAGQGAWCNGARLKTSAAKQPGEAVAAISLPARVDRNSTDLLDFIEATQVCQGVRRTGSAALNLANVASGVFDAFWASHIHPWDVAAGVLLVREAGGVVTARDGSEFNLWKPNFVAAATVELHGRLLKALTPFRRR